MKKSTISNNMIYNPYTGWKPAIIKEDINRNGANTEYEDDRIASFNGKTFREFIRLTAKRGERVKIGEGSHNNYGFEQDTKGLFGVYIYSGDNITKGVLSENGGHISGYEEWRMNRMPNYANMRKGKNAPFNLHALMDKPLVQLLNGLRFGRWFMDILSGDEKLEIRVCEKQGGNCYIWYLDDTLDITAS